MSLVVRTRKARRARVGSEFLSRKNYEPGKPFEVTTMSLGCAGFVWSCYVKNRKRKESLSALCAEVHEDDGVDPRLAFKRRQPSKTEKENRKTFQLCKQIARALSMTLAGNCGDALLGEVEVVDVVPAPDSNHLAVLVRLDPNALATPPEIVLKRLNLAMGFLRTQVAAAITRKRVPELAFRCLNQEEASS